MAKNIVLHIEDDKTILEMEVTNPQTEAVEDISSASVIAITFKKPSGAKLEKTGTLFNDGIDGLIRYDFASADLDEFGVYKVQAKITLTDGEWFTSIETFRVEENL